MSMVSEVVVENIRHIFRWTNEASCVEQDVLVVDADREDLFPSGPSWRRLALGSVVVFLRRPSS